MELVNKNEICIPHSYLIKYGIITSNRSNNMLQMLEQYELEEGNDYSLQNVLQIRKQGGTVIKKEYTLHPRAFIEILLGSKNVGIFYRKILVGYLFNNKTNNSLINQFDYYKDLVNEFRSNINTNGYIYVISTDIENVYKIGRSIDVNHRISQLQSGCVNSINILYSHETTNYVLLENIVHKVLSKYKFNIREHFKINLEYIKKIIKISDIKMNSCNENNINYIFEQIDLCLSKNILEIEDYNI